MARKNNFISKLNIFLIFAFVCGLFPAFIAPVHAVSTLINGSFEEGEGPEMFVQLTPGAENIAPWKIVSGTIDSVGDYWQPSEGFRSIDLNGDAEGIISQEFETIAGAQYTVTFDMSGNPAGGPTLKTLDVDVGGDLVSFDYDTGIEGTTYVSMNYVTKTFNFFAEDTVTVLTITSTTSGFYGPAIDNISVEQVLPISLSDCADDSWMDFIVFNDEEECVRGIQRSRVAGGPAGKVSICHYAEIYDKYFLIKINRDVVEAHEAHVDVYPGDVIGNTVFGEDCSVTTNTNVRLTP